LTPEQLDNLIDLFEQNNPKFDIWQNDDNITFTVRYLLGKDRLGKVKYTALYTMNENELIAYMQEVNRLNTMELV